MASDEHETGSTAVERPGALPRETLSIADSEPDTATAEPPSAAGRYAIEGEIARGGMGRVIAGRDHKLERPVAIKELLEDAPSGRRRFDREVKITARLQHPSILPLYDSGHWESGKPYYVMRLVSGRPMSEEIKAAETLDARLALLPHFLDAADAVAFAHRQRIIHRDLKPSNILIGELGETVVIDWGLAKEVDSDEVVDEREVDAGSDSTVAGAILGTPGYMAPEQAAGDPADQRSDVYALGSTLFHLLAGEPPYSGSDSSQIIADQLAQSPAPLAELAPGVPTDLVTIVETAMARRPGDRYTTAEELAADLRRFQTGQLVAAHHYPASQRVLRFVRRHRGLFALGVIALAVVAIVAAVAIDRITRERDIAIAASRGEADRADELLVVQATSNVESRPTAAVAILEKLPLLSRAWPRARAVFAAAMSRGVARRLPGHLGARLAWHPTENILYSAGAEVLLHDLRGDRPVTRRFATLEGKATDAVMVAAADRLAIAQTTRDIVLLGLDGKHREVIDTGAAGVLRLVALDGGELAWVTRERRVFRTEAARQRFVELDAGGSVLDLVSGAGGTWLATLSRGATRLWSRGQMSELAGGFSAAFDARGERLAVVDVDGGIVEYDLRGVEPGVRQRWTLSGTGSVAYRGHRLYAAGVDGLFELVDGKSQPIDSRPASLVETRSGPVAVAYGRLRFLGNASAELVIPRGSDRLVGGATAASERSLATANLSREIFVFDLTRLPRVIEIPDIKRAHPLDERHALVVRTRGRIDLVDLETGAIEPRAAVSELAAVQVRHGSNIAIASELTRRLVFTATEAPRQLSFDADIIDWLDLETLVLVRGNSLLRFRPLADASPALIATLPDPIELIASRDGELTVATAREIVRRPGRPDEQRLAIGRPVDGMLIESADRLYTARGTDVFVWSAFGSRRLATLARPVRHLDRHPRAGSVIAHAEGVVYQIDGDGGFTELSVPGIRLLAFAGRELSFGVGSDRRAHVADLLANRSWSFPIEAVNAHVARVPDGSLVSVAGGGRLELHRFDIARGPITLRASIERATDARIGADFDALVWPSSMLRSEP